MYPYNEAGPLRRYNQLGDRSTACVLDSFLHLYRGRAKQALLQEQESKQDRSTVLAKPASKIVVFSCSFGGGHKAAAKAVSSYLEKDYDVKVIDTSSLTGFSKGDKAMAVGLKVFNDYFIGRKNYKLSNAVDKVT